MVRTELATERPLERFYEHYFFTMEPSPPFGIHGISRLFRFPPYFNNQLDAIQFGSGLRRERDHLLLEYGVADCQALSLKVAVAKVKAGFLRYF